MTIHGDNCDCAHCAGARSDGVSFAEAKSRNLGEPAGGAGPGGVRRDQDGTHEREASRGIREYRGMTSKQYASPGCNRERRENRTRTRTRKVP